MLAFQKLPNGRCLKYVLQTKKSNSTGFKLKNNQPVTFYQAVI